MDGESAPTKRRRIDSAVLCYFVAGVDLFLKKPDTGGILNERGMKLIVTRESLQDLINRKPEATIGRALVAIFRAGQTEDERSANTAAVFNGVGFSGADARSASITAKYYIKHGMLLDWQVEQWAKPAKNGYSRLCKYVKQLNAIAEAKNEAK